MELNLNIAGWLMIVLAFLHAAFPRYFNWTNELKSLSLVNRQMMVIHTGFIALTVFLVGILCLTSGTELIGTKLGKRVCMGLGIFWSIRLFIQFFGYSSTLWKGKQFETGMHIVFTLLWIYLAGFFFWIAFH